MFFLEKRVLAVQALVIAGVSAYLVELRRPADVEGLSPAGNPAAAGETMNRFSKFLQAVFRTPLRRGPYWKSR